MERKSKRIFLWGREDLLVSSLRYYLASQKDWQVVSISKKESIEALDLVVKKKTPILSSFVWENTKSRPFFQCN